MGCWLGRAHLWGAGCEEEEEAEEEEAEEEEEEEEGVGIRQAEGTRLARTALPPEPPREEPRADPAAPLPSS